TIERNQLLQQLVSVKVANSIGQRRGRGQLKRDAIVARERESDLGVADRLQMELVLDVPALGIFRAQKFAARRHVVKKRTHLHFVPGASPPSRTMSILPPLTTISVPAMASCSRVVRRKRDTLAMLGSASPRKPNVAIASKSETDRILLVACRSSESSASSRSIPQPSSITRISEIPPRRIRMSIFRAPASMLFSTSSFTTDAGRSTTSPAAT